MSEVFYQEFEPMGNRVFVELIEEKTIRGIHVPDGYSQERLARVLAVGNGKRIKKGARKGERIPIEGIKVGDRVLLPNGLGPGSRRIDWNGKMIWSIVVDELLGVLT